MKGFNLLCLLVLATAAISLACSQDVPDPESAAQSEVGPTNAVAMIHPTVAPLMETVEPMPTAVSTEAPMPTAPPEVVSGAVGEQEALVVLGSHSAPAPSGLRSGNVGGLMLSPVPQMMATEGNLTVSAIGTVTVAPDEAYVVVIPETDYGPSGPQQFTLEDRQDIMANLVAIGLKEEAVEFEHARRYEPTIIVVEVEIDKIPGTGDAIVEAIEEVVRRSESFGVRFGLSEENCVQALSLARREAVPGTEEAADDLADALGLELGEVTGALEYPLQNVGFVVPGTDLNPCTGQDLRYRYGVLLPFDSEPEVEVSVGLQVSYRIR